MIKDGRCFFGTFVHKDNLVYASSMESNGLFVIEKNAEARLLAIFPKEKAYNRFLFADCICYDNQIVFAPESAEHIYIYDIETKQFEVIEFNLEVNYKGYDSTFKFARLIENESFFYFMPATYPYILSMDKKTKKLKYIPIEIPVEGFFLRKQYSRKNSEIYMVSLSSPYVLKFDIRNECASSVQFADSNVGGMSVQIVKGNAWVISSSNAEIYKINLNSLAVCSYGDVPRKFVTRKGQRPFACGFVKDGKLILVPMGGNVFLEFDYEREEYREYKIADFDLQNLNLACIYQNDEELVLFRRHDSMWESDRNQVIFNIEKMTALDVIFKIKELAQYNKKLAELGMEYAENIRESWIFDVGDLMNLRVKNESLVKYNTNENIGERIFAVVRKF